MSLLCLRCDITLDLKSFNIYFYAWKYLITEWLTLVSLYLTTQLLFSYRRAVLCFGASAHH